MLTSKLVRVRFARDRIVPRYLDVSEVEWNEAAERLRDLFRSQEGSTRGYLEEELREMFGSDPSQLVHQGLAKLLEDRCEFEVVSHHPPEQLREAVFLAAARERSSMTGAPPPAFARAAILGQVADTLSLTADNVEQGLFADLKSEQRLIRFKDISAEHLLQRYNVALAQAIVLRSTQVRVILRGESPQRYRQLLRLVKFHRLVCEIKRLTVDSYELQLDGPLSLFSATQKYGLQLALFLPAVLLCRHFELKAELRWGPQRKAKTFTITPADGLVSHHRDTGMYLPSEFSMFVELFRKKITDWDIAEEPNIYPLGDGFWVPDFRLTERTSGKSVLLEVLGFWRRSSAERHLERLRNHATEPFVLAVSDQLHIDDGALEGLPAAIHRFRQMPLPEEIVRLAQAV
jgi:predicted nuclease of restriction endonuclease-like RecB superfamily